MMVLNELLKYGESFMYIKNNRGPRILPWGTLVCILDILKFVSLINRTL